jgi:hypothetical protein
MTYTNLISENAKMEMNSGRLHGKCEGQSIYVLAENNVACVEIT